MDANALSRFMDKVHKDPDTGCWEWTAGKDRAGYGAFRINNKTYKSHRLIAEHHGKDITDKVVRHQCDNPGCVNPDHLLTGTQADNIQDMMDRGRHAQGSNNGASKLTESQVIAMRKKYKSGGVTIKSIAEQNNVSRDMCGRILKNLAWRHI